MATLNETTSADRVHIGFFGVRNAGKSSLINAVTGQDLAVVSDVAGTTTDPVRKAMELLPAGPVLLVDTPGIDDVGPLGEERVRKAKRVIDSTDVAVLAVDSTRGLTQADRDLITLFEEKQIRYIVALTKCDIDGTDGVMGLMCAGEENMPAAHVVCTSSSAGEGIHELKETIAQLAKAPAAEHRIVGDLLEPGSVVVLVIPIDESAPKGRIILPQQNTLRDILDAGATALVTKETELAQALASLGAPPALVVTDSQVFAQVAGTVPDSIPLTSFSILMARHRGTLQAQIDGADELDRIKERLESCADQGEVAPVPHILIAEACTHHRQCNDIGTVQLPKLVAAYTGIEPTFDFVAGNEFPEDLSCYDLVLHCGGCMVNDREMQWRARHAASQGIPFTNYGVALAKMKGILERTLAPLQAH